MEQGYLDIIGVVLDAVEEEIEEEVENIDIGAERREYLMRERIQIDRWDDTDFVYRFRVSKCTFARILAEVRPALEFINPR